MRQIDVSKWGDFRVGDLFDIQPTSRHKNQKTKKDLTNAELFQENGKNIVIVNSAYKNGVGGTTDLENTEKGNMITFSDTVDANTVFYQEKPFVGYAHVQGLYPKGKYSDKWQKYQLLFFTTVFRSTALREGFDYGNKFRRDIAVQLHVPLPVDANGDPDWDYMEKYMINIEKKTKMTIDLLQN